MPQAQRALPSTPPNATIGVGGVVRGTIKSGNTPLPGVTVTATNTLTGKRYGTVTDIRGVFAMSIPKNGRYVVRVELPGFASQTKEVLLHGHGASHILDYTLTLVSRSTQPGGGARGGMPSAAALRALSTLAQAGGGGRGSSRDGRWRRRGWAVVRGARCQYRDRVCCRAGTDRHGESIREH